MISTDRTIQRYRVVEVAENQYTTPQGRIALEKVIISQNAIRTLC